MKNTNYKLKNQIKRTTALIRQLVDCDFSCVNNTSVRKHDAAKRQRLFVNKQSARCKIDNNVNFQAKSYGFDI